jgi:hypothetical protein
VKIQQEINNFEIKEYLDNDGLIIEECEEGSVISISC